MRHKSSGFNFGDANEKLIGQIGVVHSRWPCARRLKLYGHRKRVLPRNPDSVPGSKFQKHHTVSSRFNSLADPTLIVS